MKDSVDLSDAELFQKAAAGSEAAFTALYRRHQGAIYRFALRMSGSAATAEDVTQEVFLLLIRNPGRFRPDLGTLPAYLLGVARHLVLRRLDRKARQVALEDEPRALEAAGAAGDLERRHQIETVRRAVSGLPARYREVVALCELEELSYEDAARALDCPVGTVRSRLNRARALLKAKLKAANARTGCAV
jgi:RNA polymerase sigma-70 factor (ECF subfamily)